MLASTILAPKASTSSMTRPFTVPSVPTGMKAGVGTSPCGVRKVPLRAEDSVACRVKSNMAARNVTERRSRPTGHAALRRESERVVAPAQGAAGGPGSAIASP